MGDFPLWKKPLAQPGEPIEIGHETIFYGAGSISRARVVGIGKKRPGPKVLIRFYRLIDNGFPTGEYMWTNPHTLRPWSPDGT